MDFTYNNPLLKSHWYNHSTNQWILRDTNKYKKSLKTNQLLRTQVICKNLKMRIQEEQIFNDIEQNFLKYNGYINL